MCITYHDPEGFMPSVNGVAYQVCVKMWYCGCLYSSHLHKWTCVGHGVYKSPYRESGEYTSPSLILTCAHTTLYSLKVFSLLQRWDTSPICCTLCCATPSCGIAKEEVPKQGTSSPPSTTGVLDKKGLWIPSILSLTHGIDRKRSGFKPSLITWKGTHALGHCCIWRNCWTGITLHSMGFGWHLSQNLPSGSYPWTFQKWHKMPLKKSNRTKCQWTNISQCLTNTPSRLAGQTMTIIKGSMMGWQTTSRMCSH